MSALHQRLVHLVWQARPVSLVTCVTCLSMSSSNSLTWSNDCIWIVCHLFKSSLAGIDLWIGCYIAFHSTLNFIFVVSFIYTQNVELLIKPLKLPPTLSKTITDKFAAVGILQVIYNFLSLLFKLSFWKGWQVKRYPIFSM